MNKGTKLSTPTDSKLFSEVAIFIADGNRRLMMTSTRLDPQSDAFYKAYARFFVDSLKRSLSLFFDSGLKYLFFPLFGPSLLGRKNKFQSITIPNVFRDVFQGEEWLKFFNEKGIRVKAYGDLSQLERVDVQRLDMAEGIKKRIEETSGNDKHTIFFGFMSDNTPGMEMPAQIIDFYREHKRVPTHDDMIQMYYGEPLPPVDIVILSEKINSQRAFPPLLSLANARVYYLPVPGFLGFSEVTYRKILNDFLNNPGSAPAEYPGGCLEDVHHLEQFYREHKDTVIGLRKKKGNFLVPDLPGDNQKKEINKNENGPNRAGEETK